MNGIKKLLTYLEIVPFLSRRPVFPCTDFCIVTGSDSSHYKSLRGLLKSISSNEPGTRTIVYDLGLTAMEVADLKRNFSGTDIRRFRYEDYPDFFNVRVNAGEYAWKPVIISEVLLETKGCVCWMDAGNRLTSRLSLVRKILGIAGVYSPHSQGTIADWTHPATLKHLNVDPSLLDRRNLNGACVAVNYQSAVARALSDAWRDCALTRACIAPDGSDRSNHRQDQAVITILAHQSGIARRIPSRLYGFLTHQDVD